MSSVVDYASELIHYGSVSTLSNVDVTDCVEAHLKRLGFEVERLEYDDAAGVRKASVVGKLGSGTGGLAYFGHSDVVPVGDWVIKEHGPFDPTVKEGKLYGRGSTDMKGSVACAIAAAESLAQQKCQAPVYICVTADEEVGMMGAKQVAEESQLFREMVEHQTPAIIGEPTLLSVVHGHKGGCSLRVTSHGVAAHSSTREGLNANWAMIPFMAAIRELYQELETEEKWANHNFDPPTATLNMVVSDHMNAINITPPKTVCKVYFRAMPGIDAQGLVDRCQREAEKNNLDFEIDFMSEPMFVDPEDPFIQECLKFSPQDTSRTVSYGTDGARFRELKKMVVMGPGSIAQAHRHDEWIELEQLELGVETYAKMFSHWCF